jgi:ArsR family transcriptional regulator
MEKKAALSALTGLAQESRLDIFRLLVAQGPEGLAAGEIAHKLGVANATLSFHLKEMAHAKLVTARQAGRFVYYSANFRTMNALVEYLTENCCQASSCDVACIPVAQPRRKAS